MTSFLSSSSGERSETGGRSGAREREPVTHADRGDIVPEQIAFGASPGPIFDRPKDDDASPGLRRKSGLPEDDERK